MCSLLSPYPSGSLYFYFLYYASGLSPVIFKEKNIPDYCTSWDFFSSTGPIFVKSPCMDRKHYSPFLYFPSVNIMLGTFLDLQRIRWFWWRAAALDWARECPSSSPSWGPRYVCTVPASFFTKNLPYFQTPSSLGLCIKFNLTAILLLPFGSVLDLKKRTYRLEAWPSKKQEVIGTGTYVHDTCCVVSRTPSSVVDTSVGDVQ